MSSDKTRINRKKNPEQRRNRKIRSITTGAVAFLETKTKSMKGVEYTKYKPVLVQKKK